MKGRIANSRFLSNDSGYEQLTPLLFEFSRKAVIYQETETFMNYASIRFLTLFLPGVICYFLKKQYITIAFKNFWPMLKKFDSEGRKQAQLSSLVFLENQKHNCTFESI